MTVDDTYREHADTLWAVAYRMTGSAADADDVVQDTFVKAMSHAPLRTDEPMRPWLMKVVVRASIDVLRRRKKTSYVGPWLPEPIDTGPATSAPSPERRYDELESVTFAFLMALEALSPRARAVLLLREVFDHSVREVAEMLGMTETHVKVTHHRARIVMGDYDRERTPPTAEAQERTRLVLGTLLMHFASGDHAAIEQMLQEDVRTLNDSNGKYTAARVVVAGRAKVALFWRKITPTRGVTLSVRMLNGFPALVAELAERPAHLAPRTVLLVSLAPGGGIRELNGIVAPEKLSRLFGAAS